MLLPGRSDGHGEPAGGAELNRRVQRAGALKTEHRLLCGFCFDFLLQFARPFAPFQLTLQLAAEARLISIRG